MEEPTDLGLKIGTEQELNWTSILKQSEELVIKGEADLEINNMIVKLSKRRIAEEKAKMKA